MIQQIDNKEIGTIDLLIDKLYQIELINEQGSLARRIAFIDKRNLEAEQLSTHPRQS